MKWYKLPGVVELDIGAARVALLRDEDGIADHVARGEQWERESLAVWAEWCAGAEFVVDAGAYTGIYSIVAAKLGCDVVAFEPSTPNRERLEENLALNLVSGSVEVRPEALWGSCGPLFLHNTGTRRLSSGRTLVGRSGLGETVNTVTLDELFPVGSRKIDAIKIDVEQGELKTILGGLSAIARSRPHILVEILDRNLVHVIVSYLEDYWVAAQIDGRNYVLEPVS